MYSNLSIISNYLKYILIHKWYVFVECCKLGIPFLGIIHDMSKFSHNEFMAYARNFYGEYPKQSDAFKRYPYGSIRTKESVKVDFDYAWLNHQKANKHHWQYWILVYDNEAEKIVCLDMPLRYKKEMLADWIGAGKSINGKDNKIEVWYNKNRDKIMLHSFTREWIEQRIYHV